jgi:ABC-type phosphate transport system substrate-binding protein
MKRLTLVLLCGCLAACNQTTAQSPAPNIAAASRPDTSKITDQQAFAEARAAAIAKLKDPDSAKFGPFRRIIFTNADGQSADLVCGIVNSKNSFGGYVGPTSFVHGVGYSGVTFESDPDIGYIANERCKNNS